QARHDAVPARHGLVQQGASAPGVHPHAQDRPAQRLHRRPEVRRPVRGPQKSRGRNMSKLKLIVSAFLAMVFAGALALPVQAKEWPTRMPNGDPVITIYHMEGRRSERIVW